MCLQLLLNLNLGEGFDDIALLNIVEVDETDTALEAGSHLFDIVFITFQGVEIACMDHNSVANEPRFVASVHLAFGYKGTGNSSDLRYFEYFAHLNFTCYHFFFHFIEHSDHCRFHVVDGVVDHGIGIDLYTFLLSQLACSSRRAHLEAHYDGVRSIGQGDITL